MKDIALDGLTLRKYEMPSKADRREMIRKYCLSLGLLQEGDSRDIIVDILLALLDTKKQEKLLESVELAKLVEQIRKSYGLECKGISEPNIRRQLKRLRDLMIVEKIKNNYRLSEFDSLTNITSRLFSIKLKSISERILEYARAIDANESNASDIEK